MIERVLEDLVCWPIPQCRRLIPCGLSLYKYEVPPKEVKHTYCLAQFSVDNLRAVWVSSVFSCAFSVELLPCMLYTVYQVSWDDNSCCSTWAFECCDTNSACFQHVSLSGTPARYSRRLCHTSSDEGAEGFLTRRSMMITMDQGLSLGQDNAVQVTQGRLQRGSLKSYRYEEVRPKV